MHKSLAHFGFSGEDTNSKIRSQAIFIRPPSGQDGENFGELATLAFSAHFSSSSPCFQPSSRFTAGLVNENREFRVVILYSPPPHSLSITPVALSVSQSPLFVAERAAAEALLPDTDTQTQTDRHAAFRHQADLPRGRGGRAEPVP